MKNYKSSSNANSGSAFFSRLQSWFSSSGLDRVAYNQWAVNAWEKVKSSSIIKKAKELGMCPEPGLPVEGYVDDLFEDAEPQGAEEEYGDEGL